MWAPPADPTCPDLPGPGGGARCPHWETATAPSRLGSGRPWDRVQVHGWSDGRGSDGRGCRTVTGKRGSDCIAAVTGALSTALDPMNDLGRNNVTYNI